MLQLQLRVRAVSHTGRTRKVTWSWRVGEEAGSKRLFKMRIPRPLSVLSPWVWSGPGSWTLTSTQVILLGSPVVRAKALGPGGQELSQTPSTAVQPWTSHVASLSSGSLVCKGRRRSRPYL